MEGWGGGGVRSHSVRGIWSRDNVGSPYQQSRTGDCFPQLQGRGGGVLCGTHVLVQTDSTTVMHHLNRMGAPGPGACMDWSDGSFSGSHREFLSWQSLFRLWQRGSRSPLLSLSRGLGVHHRMVSKSWGNGFNFLFTLWGIPTVDLFATRLNNKVEAFYSCLLDLVALPGNPVQVDWSWDLLYMYLPCPCPLLFIWWFWEEAQVIAILPQWPSRGWFPLVLQLLVNFPVLLLAASRLLGDLKAGKEFEGSCSYHFRSSFKLLYLECTMPSASPFLAGVL